MRKRIGLFLTIVVTASSILSGCGGVSLSEPVNDEEVLVEQTEETSEENYYDEEFLETFAKAVTRRQELGEKVCNALTVCDVLEKELAMHPDYSTMKFKDDILKTYAMHYRESVETQLKLWKANAKQGKKTEGYREQDFDDACQAWITQVQVVNALVNDYDLDISDELAEEYRLEEYFWFSGLYKVIWKYSDNSSSLFDEMDKDVNTDDKGVSTINIKIKNTTKYDLSGIHILVYHLTKNSYVLEKEIPVEYWEIDGTIEKEFDVNEKFISDDHIFQADSGLSLSIYPNRVKWI